VVAAQQALAARWSALDAALAGRPPAAAEDAAVLAQARRQLQQLAAVHGAAVTEAEAAVLARYADAVAALVRARLAP
jgi:hypothetical protein